MVRRTARVGKEWTFARGWRCDFSKAVAARARLRDKPDTNQHNLLCQPRSAPGSLAPSREEGTMDTTPENLAAADRGQVWPHRIIRRGDAVRPLPPHDRSLDDLIFEVGGVRLGLG